MVRARRERHEGRRRGDARAGASWAAARAELALDLALPLLRARGAAGDESPLPRALRRRAGSCARPTLVIVLEPTDNAIHARLRRQPHAPRSRSTGGARTPPGPGLARTRSTGRSTGLAPVGGARAASTVDVDGLVFCEVVSAVRDPTAAIADNVVPDRPSRSAQLPLCARTARPTRPRGPRLRELVGDAKSEIARQLAAGARVGATGRSSTRLRAAGELADRAEAGVDAGRATSPRRPRRRQPRPGRDALSHTRATSGSRSASSCGRSRPFASALVVLG